MRPVLLLSMITLLLVTSCGTSPPAGQQTAPPTGQGTGSATTGGPTSTTSTPPPPPERSCGPRTLIATAQQQPGPRCLDVGASLHITTAPSPNQPWSVPTSSDKSILRCAERPLADGAAEATCTALHRGTATVTTTTAPFAGDPHGPPPSQWQLVVNVV